MPTCTGPYANAVLRFQIDFAGDYPQRPPLVTFQSDVFHPLVTPLTTYTYSTRDAGADTQSAVDEHRLPPGGLSLRHGFPEWFGATDTQVIPSATASTTDAGSPSQQADAAQAQSFNAAVTKFPHVIELLQYLRIVFDTDEVLDTIPLAAASNAGAWHAWQSFRSKKAGTSVRGAKPAGESSQPGNERSLSPRQQPGGARRPGEWNWQGVWEDRVRRSVQSTQTEPALYGGDHKDVVSAVHQLHEILSSPDHRSAFRRWTRKQSARSHPSSRRLDGRSSCCTRRHQVAPVMNIFGIGLASTFIRNSKQVLALQALLTTVQAHQQAQKHHVKQGGESGGRSV